MIDGVPCLYFAPAGGVIGTLLYCHANATDLGEIRGIMHALAQHTGLAVLAVEYPGYGAVAHEATSLNGCVDNAQRVADYCRRTWPDRHLLLVGRSIGSGVAAQLAARLMRRGNPAAALALISPFRSLNAVGREMAGAAPCSSSACVADVVVGRVFDTETALRTLCIPTLICHGAHDRLFSLEHARALQRASAAPGGCVLEVLSNSTHNDLEWPLIFAALRQLAATAQTNNSGMDKNH
jgi:uncharacterized protein